MPHDHKTIDTARWAKRFRHSSEVIAFLVATLGLVVLCGWGFNVRLLTYIRPTFQSMKVNTALSFLCLGAGLWLDDELQRIRRILGLLVVVIAGLTLAEYASHVSLGIDQLLFRDTRIPSLSAYPGRMAISTATCFLLLGLAVTFLGPKKAIALRHTLVAVCFAFSIVALCGYLYGAKPLFSVTSFSTIGVHTAAGLFAACLAYFLARPDEGIVSIAARDADSGLLLRTLFPAIVVVPILIGWLRLEGQKANLYDTQFGVALQVLGSIGCLTALTLLAARSMEGLELERSRAEAVRARSAAIVESSDDAIIATDVNGTVTDWNRGAERLFGYLASEAIGKNISFLAPTGQLDQAQHIFKKVISRVTVKRHDTVRQRKDGTHVEISLTVSPIVDAERRVVGAAGIARDISARKLAEDRLREGEERFRLVANAAPVMIWMSGLDKKPTYFNQLWLDFTGLSETDLQAGLVGIVHPEDYQQCHDAYCRAFDQRQPFRRGCRLRRHDGQYRWMLDIGVPRLNKDGSLAGYIGSCIDVTDHKLAEEALSGMTRKLVESQEQERARIARELHDDINQRLAMLAVELGQVEDDHPDLAPEVLNRMHELGQQTSEISADVQALSHDLHSSQLEYLGVVAGIKSWCREFGERRGMQIDFRHDVRSTLPQEIGLCLFRVIQESLHNAAKHSGVKRIEVQLHEQSGDIHLIIRDLGMGFDVEAVKQDKGLGLTSMRERVRLVNGTISIESKPMGGTIIYVRVPLGSERLPDVSEKLSERAVG